MSYIKDLLKHENEDFKRGMIEGIRMHAIWKDGTQVVGCMEKPLKSVIEEINEAFDLVGAKP